MSVFLNQGRKLHTTHSWDFMLLEKDGVIHPSSLWKKARFGEDTIIGNLDTGNNLFLSFFRSTAFISLFLILRLINVTGFLLIFYDYYSEY